jgi:hypothetical protein
MENMNRLCGNKAPKHVRAHVVPPVPYRERNLFVTKALDVNQRDCHARHSENGETASSQQNFSLLHPVTRHDRKKYRKYFFLFDFHVPADRLLRMLRTGTHRVQDVVSGGRER